MVIEKEVPSDVLIEILTKRGMARFLICSNYSTSLSTITQLMSALNSLISHYKTIGFHLAVFNCIVSPARITAHSSWWNVEVVEWQINKGQAFRFNQLLFHLKAKSMRGLKYSCKNNLHCSRQNPQVIPCNHTHTYKTDLKKLSKPGWIYPRFTE